MENRYFQATSQEVDAARAVIRDHLSGRPEVAFAYLHGSFVTDGRFRDIDVALYLNRPVFSPVQIELELETQLSALIREWPVDARVLNGAPLSFRYSVIKNGQLLFAVDDNARSDFVEATLCNYFDFSPFRKAYLKETLGLEV